MKKHVALYRCKLVRDHTVDYIGSVSCSNDLFNVVKKLGLADCSEEYFFMFAFNAKGEIIAFHEISHGDLTSSSAHPREIFKRALLCNAGAVAFAHNHPSGNSTPSGEDVKTTTRLKECGELLGIPVIDHIIVGSPRDLASMKELGLL